MPAQIPHHGHANQSCPLLHQLPTPSVLTYMFFHLTKDGYCVILSSSEDSKLVASVVWWATLSL